MQGLNKKGQEGFSTTGLLAVVLGLIALVVIAMFIYNMYSKPGELSKLLPDQFQQALTYCQNSPFKSQQSQYCTDYKEFTVKSGLTSAKYYYNCFDLFQQSGEQNVITCDESSKRTYCINLVGTNKLDSGVPVYVSQKACLYTAGSEKTTDSNGVSIPAKNPTLMLGVEPLTPQLLKTYPSFDLEGKATPSA